MAQFGVWFNARVLRVVSTWVPFWVVVGGGGRESLSFQDPKKPANLENGVDVAFAALAL